MQLVERLQPRLNERDEVPDHVHQDGGDASSQ